MEEAYGGSYRQSSSVGDEAVISINAAQFELIYSSYYNRGDVDVYLDGEYWTTFSQYSLSLVRQERWKSPILAIGDYEIKFVHDNGKYLDIDAIEVLPLPEAIPPTAINDLTALTGTNNGEVDLDWTAVGDDGNIGTASSYQVRYSPSEIVTQGDWDGALEFVTAMVPQAPGATENLMVTGLPMGKIYYFAVRAMDDSSNLGDISNSPSATSKAPPPLGAGVYDDDHSSWVYTGNWVTKTGSGTYGGTFHQSLSVGDEAAILINAAQFELIYSAYYNRGDVDVYLDGEYWTTFSQNNSKLVRQSRWTSPMFAEGVHEIKFVHTSGSYLDIDAIEILPLPDTIPPAAINDLTAVTGSEIGSVDLNWTAVGDDGNVGTADAYEVRYSLIEIDSQGTWDAATEFPNSMSPKVAGQPESLTVTGLTPGVEYSFAVRVRDEQLNLGWLSNNPSAVAKFPPPPANDDFGSAEVIDNSSLPFTDSEYDISSATVAPDDPEISNCGVGKGLSTLWYSIVAPGSGFLFVDTLGSNYDTVLAVWKGDRGSLEVVACNDDATETIFQSSLVAYVNQDEQYYIEVVDFKAGGSPAPDSKSLAPSQPQNAPYDPATLNINVGFEARPLVGLGTTDDSDNAWLYNGNWAARSKSGCYDGTFHQSKKIGNTATIGIDGRQFELVYFGYYNRGLVDVYVDGAKIATIDEYSKKLAYQQVSRRSPVLSEGTHTVTFVHAFGSQITIDAINIIEPDLVIPGTITDLAAITGTNNGEVDLSWTAVGDDGNVDIASSYQVRYSPSEIVTQGDWDGALEFVTDMVPQAPGVTENLTVTGVPMGQLFYFAVQAEDESYNLGGISNSPSTTPKSPPPLGTGIYDDTHSSWVYTGDWVSKAGAGTYGGTFHQSSSLGDGAAILINAAQFELIYSANFNRAEVDVYLDGEYWTTFSQYNPSLARQTRWPSPMFAEGVHEIKFINADGKYFDIDGIEVLPLPEAIPPTAINDLTALTGTNNGEVDLSWTAVGDDGNVGTASSYQVRYSPSEIVTQGDWDGALEFVTDMVPQAPGATENLTVTGVPMGQLFYFAVRAMDDSSNMGDISNSPSATSKAPPPLGADVYDDDHSSWVYTGDWVSKSATGTYGGTFHQSSSLGDGAAILINAAQFELIYSANFNRAEVDVYLDGEYWTTFSQYNPSLARQTRWPSPMLTEGVHEIKFVNADGKYFDVDGIEVLP